MLTLCFRSRRKYLHFAFCLFMSTTNIYSQIQEHEKEDQKLAALIKEMGGKVIYNNYHHIISVLLPDMQVTDSDLKQISIIASLQIVNLSRGTNIGTVVTAELVELLKKQVSLQSIEFNGVSVTDTGIEYLAILPNIKTLELGGV